MNTVDEQCQVVSGMLVTTWYIIFYISFECTIPFQGSTHFVA